MIDSARGLEQWVARNLAEAVGPKARVVVAVSGGSDSMALLALTEAARKRLSLALRPICIDHGLRPESGAEAAWVQRTCYRRFGWPVRVARAVVRAAQGESIEMAARRVRYAILEAFRQEVRADAVLLGHQADDQAETVLMRLFTGTGLEGLGGMAPVRGPWVRPLLGVRREALRAYLKAQGIGWLEDPSNRDLRWLRNRIRYELLPWLRREVNPAVEVALVRLAEQARAWRQWASQWAETWLKAQGVDPTEAVWVLPPEFHHLPEPLRVKVLALYGERHGLRLQAAHLRQALRGGAQWPKGHAVEHGRDGRVRLGPRAEPQVPEADVWPLPKAGLVLPGGGLVGGPDGEQAPWRSRLGLGPDELAVRFWRPGDRLRPYGLGGHKKLQDVFVDRKIPRPARARWPLLVARADPERVLAVVGLVVDETAAGNFWTCGYWPQGREGAGVQSGVL
ncbi:MAG: tRNA lysidine(34) synthetase TilS [Firmicutes bacterium]|nr:tRNA lysidine(34) synthetase TilS [Alicyclobacillaceae bacterium]MCL6497174.1 tRNA lysidine(34) synthetase TilS [Bacillota bacterium]